MGKLFYMNYLGDKEYIDEHSDEYSDEYSDPDDFGLLPSDYEYDSDDFDFESFPKWSQNIKDEFLINSTKELYNSIFQSRNINELYLLETWNAHRKITRTTSENSFLWEGETINSSSKINFSHIDIDKKNLSKPKAKISDFEIGRPIGSGTFGTIYLARAKNNHELIVSIKVSRRRKITKHRSEQLSEEIYHLNQLNHENIISFFDYFYDRKKIYIVTEYGCCGDLYEELCNKFPYFFTEKESSKIISQVALAIKECHENNIVHRDIKPENLVWTIGRKLKLIDFGWSTTDKNSILNGVCGTLYCIPPEVLRGDSYDRSVDIWALGVLLYELVSGATPFEDENEDITRSNIERINFKFPSHFSDNLKDLLKCIFQKDPKNRPNIYQFLSHRWFNSIKNV